MTNLECAVAVLAMHREARQWDDNAVAADMLRQLDVDPAGDAKKARPAPDPSMISEGEVLAHEATAKEAAERAKAARDRLNAQVAVEAKANAVEAVDRAKVAVDAARPSAPGTPVVPSEQMAAENMRRAAEQRQEADRARAAQTQHVEAEAAVNTAAPHE